MKKFFITTVLLFTVIGMTMAQSTAMMTKVDSTTTIVQTDSILCENRLSVEIISVSFGQLDHPQYPATGIGCPFFDAFQTSQPYAWYQWESSFREPSNNDIIIAEVYSSGYIKVTVGDGNGHTG